MLRVAGQGAAFMSETRNKHAETSDPFEPFRAIRDKYLDAMAKSMVETVNSESYAQASGAMLEGYLTATAPLREAMDRSMKQALEQLSLPSRQEVAALAERFTHVEMRLDDMDAKLDRIESLLGRDQPAPLPEARNVGEGSAVEKGVNAGREPGGGESRLGARGRFVRKRGGAGKRS
ncbi:MAG: poly(R)-hydroxyalkanoic acid synthase subunit PhaE [Acidobacteriaceae bacterium]